MPVPIDRDDGAYFAPLRDLKNANADIYLGLLHLADGIEGAKRRIAAAGPHIDTFGIATECGLGRSKTPNTVTAILKLYADVAML
jgi:hypothetical protein